MARKVQTVGVIIDGDKILLGMKKEGFGEGKWNGFGGKVEAGETVEEAMKREFLEECDIEVLGWEEMGTIEFHFENDELVPEVHFFRITRWEGDPLESDEMKPAWFAIDNIPYDEMWPDDRYWLPLMLEGQKFGGSVSFDSHGKIRKNEIGAI